MSNRSKFLSKFNENALTYEETTAMANTAVAVEETTAIATAVAWAAPIGEVSMSSDMSSMSRMASTPTQTIQVVPMPVGTSRMVSAPAQTIQVVPMPVGTSRMVSAPAQTFQVVPLPIGLKFSELGIEIGGSPPTITNAVQEDSPIYGLIHMGQYCHGIGLHQVEIVHLSNAAHLIDLIQANHQNPRDLLVSDTPFFIDPYLQGVVPSGYSNGALYKHMLPTTTTEDLGVQFQGFPPAIQGVSPHSPCAGRLHPHQTVECLIIPGREVFSLKSGAFTSAKLVDRLNNSSQIPGRILVVKDGVGHSQKGKSSNFDLGGTFTNQTGWSLGRMFGAGKKQYK